MHFEVVCGTNQKSNFPMHVNFFIAYSKGEKKRKLTSGTIIGKRRTCRHSNSGIEEHVCLYAKSSLWYKEEFLTAIEGIPWLNSSTGHPFAQLSSLMQELANDEINICVNT